MWSNVVSASRYAALPFEVMTRVTARLISTPIPMKPSPALKQMCVNCQQAQLNTFESGNGATSAVDLPAKTHSGYLSIDREGAALFYVYYAAKDVRPEDAPVVLWLQGGPGASSLMGNFYELIGPQKVTKDLRLRDNPWAWNRHANLLFIEQPLGTGYSVPGSAKVPETLLESSQDLYAAVQNFFRAVLGNPSGLQRQLIVAGESYGGKFVPGLAHVILQLAARHKQALACSELRVEEELPSNSPQLAAPVFELVGIMIGNGLTDRSPSLPRGVWSIGCLWTRWRLLPTKKWQPVWKGVIDDGERDTARRIVSRILELAEAGQVAGFDWAGWLLQQRSRALIGWCRGWTGQWQEAHTQRLMLIEFLTVSGGLGTTLDVRRYEGYDGKNTVREYLNRPEVKEALGVASEVEWIRKNPCVKIAMYADNLKSAKPLLPDILANVPVLLYQAVHCVQEQPTSKTGVASNEAWIYDLEWPGKDAFNAAPRELLYLAADKTNLTKHSPRDPAAEPRLPPGRVVGYHRESGRLTHVMLRNAGHMAPHDEPDAARAMFESWLRKKVLKGEGSQVDGDWVAVAA
eukprot:jgi/Botrbrau1/17183/Bobra.0157s0074.1